MRADLREIHEAATRAAALTRQLLAFSRQQVLAARRAEPRTRSSPSMEQMLQRLIGEDMEMSSSARPGDLPDRASIPGRSNR